MFKSNNISVFARDKYRSNNNRGRSQPILNGWVLRSRWPWVMKGLGESYFWSWKHRVTSEKNRSFWNKRTVTSASRQSTRQHYGKYNIYVIHWSDTISLARNWLVYALESHAFRRCLLRQIVLGGHPDNMRRPLLLFFFQIIWGGHPDNMRRPLLIAPNSMRRLSR